MTAAGNVAERFRRSPHVACYWKEGVLLLHNFARDSLVEVQPIVLEILDALSAPRALPELCEALPHFKPAALEGAVRQLADCAAILRSDVPPNSAEATMEDWAPWNPAVGLLHSWFRLATSQETHATREQRLRGKALTVPMPAPIKRYPGAERVPLSDGGDAGELDRTLLERRTWRRFSDEPIAREQLAKLLRLTWGVQKWAVVREQGNVVLKTSPSGGARHSIEVYLAVRNVSGLDPGLYHYAADTNELEVIRRFRPGENFEQYLAGQNYFAGASALLFMAPVFARMLWRYRDPKAYRAIHFEAGHLCQTFCLLATRAGLAPFCTAAFDTAAINQQLGLDGVAETAFYLAGVGSRLPGAESDLGPGQLPEWHTQAM